MSKNVANKIIECLEEAGIQYVFGMPGYQNLELYDSMIESSLKHVLVTSENWATLMSNGYSWASGKVGVCFSIPGPGFTNMFTGIAGALVDSIPLVVFVIGLKRGDKSFCVHEIPQIESVRPIVKKVFTIDDSTGIEQTVRQALIIAKSGEPGPVVVEVGQEVLEIEVTAESGYESFQKKPIIDSEEVANIVKTVKKSKRCGVYVGKGASEAHKQVIELIEILSSPIATTISGKGVVPEDHPLSVGFGFGSFSMPIADEVFSRCDTLLAIGCKFSEIATGQWGLKFPENFIHIDSNADVLNKNYSATHAVCADAADFIAEILKYKDEIKKDEDVTIIDSIKVGKESFRQRDYKISEGVVHPLAFFIELRKHMKRDDVLTVDCGYHQLWAFTDFEVYEPRSFITSCDYQTMGFGVPSAIGAKIAHPQKNVVCVCGDGGFLMNGLELLTARKENLGIKVLVFNDGELGLIKHNQVKVYGRTIATEVVNPDFCLLAQSLGIKYVAINNHSELEDALHTVFSSKDVVLVDVNIEYAEEPVYFQGVAKNFWNNLSFEGKLKLTQKVKGKKKHGNGTN